MLTLFTCLYILIDSIRWSTQLIPQKSAALYTRCQTLQVTSMSIAFRKILWANMCTRLLGCSQKATRCMYSLTDVATKSMRNSAGTMTLSGWKVSAVWMLMIAITWPLRPKWTDLVLLFQSWISGLTWPTVIGDQIIWTRISLRSLASS